MQEMEDRLLRDRIADMTTEVFAEEGPKFTMQDVAARMQISKKTIYRAFASKEELLLYMLDRGFAKIQERKAEVLAMDLPIAEKLEKVMIALPEEYRLLDFRRLTCFVEKYPSVYESLRRHLETDWEPVEALIRKGQQEGELAEFSIPLLKLVFSSALERFLSEDALVQAGIGYQEALGQMMTLLVLGMKTRGSEEKTEEQGGKA